MGGIGSGRRSHFGAKDTTEGARPLDIRKLNRFTLLSPGHSFGWQWTYGTKVVSTIRIKVQEDSVFLGYKYRSHHQDEWESVVERVDMDRTACTYGGTRLWWLCPACGKRVAILFGPGRRFVCRGCNKLVYESQREDKSDRAARRADKIRRKLGWPAGIFNGPGGVPKGMRRKTFERLTEEHRVLVDLAMAGIAKKLGILERLARELER